MLRQLLVLLALSSVALAALSRRALDPKPCKYADEEGCYIKELDEVIPFNSSKPSNTQCEEYRCTETEVVIASCGVYAGPRPPPDTSKPYPDCC